MKNENYRPDFFSIISVFNLEAPVIITLWQITVSKSLNISITIPEYSVCFLSVWLGYSADRFIDHLIFAKIPEQNLAMRHCFWRHKKVWFVLIWLTTLMTAIYLSYKFTSKSSIIIGCLIALCAIVYILLNSIQNKLHISFKKEVFITFLLTISVGFPFINTISILTFFNYLLPIFLLFRINLFMITEEQEKYDLVLGIPKIKYGQKRKYTSIFLLFISIIFIDDWEYNIVIIIALFLMLIVKRNKLTYYFYDLAIGIPPFISIFLLK